MQAADLRTLLADADANRRCILVPAAHDAMSATLAARAGCRVVFMSGFAVSASKLALPDAGLISYGEQLEVGRCICEATHNQILVIGDGDTGFGSAANMRRTLKGYALAGFAGITIEDQSFPKRCSYARGVQVEARDAAIARVRSAIAARDEMRAADGLDLVVRRDAACRRATPPFPATRPTVTSRQIVARTDVRNAASGGGLAEAIARCRAFASLGADVVYAEGIRDASELARLADALPGGTRKMLAQVERPGSSLISPSEAGALGFSLSLMGLSVFSVAMRAMKQALRTMASGGLPPADDGMPLDELYEEVGFPAHYEWEARFEPGAPRQAGRTAASGERRAAAAAAAAAAAHEEEGEGEGDEPVLDEEEAGGGADETPADEAAARAARIEQAVLKGRSARRAVELRAGRY